MTVTLKVSEGDGDGGEQLLYSESSETTEWVQIPEGKVEGEILSFTQRFWWEPRPEQDPQIPSLDLFLSEENTNNK